MSAAVTVLRTIDRMVMGSVIAAASIALALAAILSFAQVVLRFAFSSPISWVDASAQLLVVWMVHLGVAVTMRTGTLVSVDFVRHLVGPRLRPYLSTAIAIATFVFLANLFWFGLEIVQRVQFQNHPALGISIAWGYAAVPVGAALSIFAAAARIIEQRMGALA